MAKYRITMNVNRDPERSPLDSTAPIRLPDVWHLAEGGGLPGRLWFKLAPDGIGGWVCTRAEVDATDGKPLTTSSLRSIPLTQVIQQLLTMKIPALDRGGALDLHTGVREHYDSDRWELDDFEARGFYLGNAPAPRKAAPRTPRGGTGPSSDELTRFAQAYRWALRNDRSRPIAATAERLQISRATAHRWLKLIDSNET